MSTTTTTPSQARDRPTCRHCGGTGTVVGPRLYPGTHAARRHEPCPDCTPAPPRGDETAPRNRQQRILAQRAWLTDLAGMALTLCPESSEVDWDTRTACLSYTVAGHRYVALITVNETL